MSVELTATVVEVVWESVDDPRVAWVVRYGGESTGGGGGAELSDATPAALGVADAGDGTRASRSDHVHPMPTSLDLPYEGSEDPPPGWAGDWPPVGAPETVSPWLEFLLAGVVSANADQEAHFSDTTDVHGIANTADLISEGDPRLSNARTPTSHAHSAADITSGTMATARLGTGTANSGTYLRGDQTWGAPPGGGAALGLVRPYQPGYFYATPRGTTGTASFAANFIRLTPFIPWSTHTFDRCGLYTTQTATGKVRVGIYDSAGSGGAPLNLILDSGEIDTSSAAGDRLATISQSLTGGTLYWFASIFNVTTTAAHMSRSAHTETDGWGVQGPIGSGNAPEVFYQSQSFAALPATLTSLTSIVLTTAMPSVWVRA